MKTSESLCYLRRVEKLGLLRTNEPLDYSLQNRRRKLLGKSELSLGGVGGINVRSIKSGKTCTYKLHLDWRRGGSGR